MFSRKNERTKKKKKKIATLHASVSSMLRPAAPVTRAGLNSRNKACKKRVCDANVLPQIDLKKDMSAKASDSQNSPSSLPAPVTTAFL